ncbi:MAG: hypothetical protein IMW89_22390 [Ktedonobacteraceae bacterium]|nr:hypothetical protein [Ktedonobacteraceae bacterium]
MTELLVNLPDYYRAPVKPRGFAEFCDMVETGGRITGIWELAEQDARTGRITKRVWNKNVITDSGAIQILKRAINSSSASLPGIFNNLLITNNSGSTTLTSAIAASTTNITSISVASLPAAIPSGTQLTLGYGSATSQVVTTSALAAQGATSISTVSFDTDASHSYPVGTAVVPLPAVTDNPTNVQLTANVSAPVVSYSGNLDPSAFTFTPTSGAGNRTDVVTFTFTNAGGTPVGFYTDCWIVNVASAATTDNYVAHEINVPMRCDASNNLVATVTIKI